MGYIFDAIHRANQGLAPKERPGAADTSAALDSTPAAPDAPKPAGESALTPAAVATARQSSGPEQDSAALQPNVDDRLVMLTDPSSVMAEEYRSIRTGVLARWQNKRRLVHTITSATPQEGKTITSLNLGLSFAELHNRKTIVIEADLRLPQFANLCNLGPTPGLMGVLLDGVRLADAAVQLPGNRLHMLCAGRCANDQAVQVLSSPAMASLLGQLRQEYDHIIIDTPPVVELADAGILGALSDDVLLIVRMGITPRSLVEQAVRTLASYNAPVAGVIGTDQKPQHKRYYRYGYGYSYRYYRQSTKGETTRRISKAA